MVAFRRNGWSTSPKQVVDISEIRTTPPEDVGGIWGDADFLNALADPTHEEHHEYREWIGRDAFDPDTFNLDEVNDALRRIR